MFHVLDQYDDGKRHKEIAIIQSDCGNDYKNGINRVWRDPGEGEVNSKQERTWTDWLEEVPSGRPMKGSGISMDWEGTENIPGQQKSLNQGLEVIKCWDYGP